MRYTSTSRLRHVLKSVYAVDLNEIGLSALCVRLFAYFLLLPDKFCDTYRAVYKQQELCQLPFWDFLTIILVVLTRSRLFSNFILLAYKQTVDGSLRG